MLQLISMVIEEQIGRASSHSFNGVVRAKRTRHTAVNRVSKEVSGFKPHTTPQLHQRL